LINYTREFLFSNRTTNQTIAKNTFWLFIAEGVNKGLLFLLTIILARYLGAEGYGQFAFAMSFTAFFLVFSDLGLTFLNTREVAKNKAFIGNFVNIITLKFVFSVLTALSILLILLITDHPKIVIQLGLIFTCVMILNSFGEFFRSYCRATQRMELEFISKGIQGITTFMLGIIFIFLSLNILYIATAIAIGAGISTLIAIFIFYKQKYIFIKGLHSFRKKDLLRKSLPYSLNILFVGAYTKIDVILLGFYSIDYNAIGFYAASYLLLSVFTFPLVYLSKSILPKTASITKKEIVKKKFIIRWGLFIALVGIIISAALFFNSGAIIKLFYGDSYLESINAFMILSFALFPIIVNTYIVDTLYATGLAGKASKGTFLALVTNIIANVTLIPILGIIGCAIAAVISETLLLLYGIVILIKEKLI